MSGQSAPNIEEELARAEEMVSEIAALPSMPQAINKVVRMLSDSDTDVAEVAKAIQQDIGLAGRVLKVVNSPFYGFATQISSVERAVALLGLNAVRNLAMAAAIEKVLVTEKDEYFDPESFWKHSLGSAFMAMSVAKRLHMEDPEEAFTCAMLHDIGRMVEAQFFYPDYVEITSRKRQNGSTLLEEEMNILGVTHQGLGAAVLKRWHFPPAIVGAALCHHRNTFRVESDLAPPPPLLAAVALADSASYALEPSAENLDETLLQTRRNAQEELSISDDDLKSLAAETGNNLKYTLEAFGIGTNTEGDAQNAG